VTLDATANPSHAGLGANPALVAALAIAGVAAATLAGAWFFQLVLDIRPCPLCLEQRYAYYLALPLGLLVAFAASKDAPRPVLLAGLAILLLAALANVWLGTSIENNKYVSRADHLRVRIGICSGEPIARGADLSGLVVSRVHRVMQWAGAGEVVLSVKAAGVNFPDVLMSRGLYQLRPSLPFSPGGEVALHAAGVLCGPQ
jgi:hypothetical protein